MTTDSFEATYAVKMHCDDCTSQIKQCLKDVPGIANLKFDLPKQIVSVEGSAVPSTIVAALATCGRDAIIRGTGKPDSSAVAILETHQPADTAVRGLVRMVQVSDNRTLFDVTLNGMPRAGAFSASVHELGDVSQGAASTGAAWHTFDEPISCTRPSDLGPGLYSGSALLSAPVAVWELIGRSFVVAGQPALCGVVARSAGVWENDKQVCACSGKTVWQERQDALRLEQHVTGK